MVSIIAGSEQLVFNGIFSSMEFLNFEFNHSAYSRTKCTFLEKLCNQDDSCCDISSPVEFKRRCLLLQEIQRLIRISILKHLLELCIPKGI